MGTSQSLLEKKRDYLVASVETEVYRKMMVQREAEMAINIAKARDNIHVFGFIWLTYGFGLMIVPIVAKRLVPSPAAIPLIVGGIILGNMADVAYGNKLARVNKEAAYLLEYERARFVPFPQAPFARFYSAEERALLYDKATASGDMAPFSVICRSLPGQIVRVVIRQN
jgi:Uncharacterised conserved protein (DUF2368)